jgi:hypothetical protein
MTKWKIYSLTLSKYFVALFCAFICTELSFIIVATLYIHMSKNPGEFFEGIFLYATSHYMVYDFVFLYTLWIIILMGSRIRINEKFLFYWVIGILIGILVGMFRIWIPIWPI